MYLVIERTIANNRFGPYLGRSNGHFGGAVKIKGDLTLQWESNVSIKVEIVVIIIYIN